MPDTLGISFSPANQPGTQGSGSRPSPVQQAIQTLSLRIPPHAGASAFTPQALLESPGGSALGGTPDAILELLKKILFGPQPPGAPGQPGAAIVGVPSQLPPGSGAGGTIPGPASGGSRRAAADLHHRQRVSLSAGDGRAARARDPGRAARTIQPVRRTTS
jgi:hypothetical protein